MSLGALAAQIDEDLAAFVPQPGQPRKEAFTREHVESLRVAGATKAQVLDYARAAGFTTAQRNMLAADLDSYGEWS